MFVYPILAVLGLAVGSFLNVCIDRLPVGQSLLRPRSHCSACGRTLAARDLIPVASYLVLRGRCRSCSARIPKRLLAIEAGTGLLFLLLWGRFGASPQFAFAALAACVFIVVFVTDLERGLVPNCVIYPAVGVALIAMPFTVGPDLHQAVGGGAIGLALLWLIVVLYPQGMGLGDLKLATFVGLVAGFPAVLVALFLAFVLGGTIAVLALVSGRRRMQDAVPFAPFLATGGMVAMTYGEEILRWYPAMATS